MKQPEQGDIFFIKFGPSEGHEYEKIRPAVILTKTGIISHANVISVVPLTGSTDNKITEDILLKKDKTNNLFQDSIIKMHHITACNYQNRCIKYIGKVDPETWKKIQDKIKEMFCT